MVKKNEQVCTDFNCIVVMFRLNRLKFMWTANTEARLLKSASLGLLMVKCGILHIWDFCANYLTNKCY